MPVMVVGAVKLLFSPLNMKESTVAFTKPSFVSLPDSEQLGRLINFKGSINKNKLWLEWMVKENEKADQFVIEKSVDGKNFEMAALVFGTDKPDTENYRFYEKAADKKISYRIKLITKKQEMEYSSIIEVNPDPEK